MRTHEPLISRDIWDRVQAKLGASRKIVRRTKNNVIGLYSGLIKCSNCGHPLAYMRKQLKDREKGVYRCSRYNNNGGKACTPHYIDEEYINAFVLNDIRNYARLAVHERKQTAERLYIALRKHNSSETSVVNSKIRTTENRLNEITSRLKKLYEDKCTGNLPEDIFKSPMADFTTEKSELEQKLLLLYDELSRMTETTCGINEWLDLIGQYENIQELDRETVCGLIQEITVFEKDKSSGHTEQEIRIEYRFIKNLLQNEKEDIA